MYKAYSLQYACPCVFDIVSNALRLDDRCIELVWNAAQDWCECCGGVEFVQPQFVTLGNKTWIYIIYKEKSVD